MTSGPSSPCHVAVIMDGNGRWAQRRRRPRRYGHEQGQHALRRIIRACPDRGISHLTLFCFSTENWTRPAGEVQSLMDLLRRYFLDECKALHENNVRIQVIGRRDRLEQDILEQLDQAVTLTQANTGLVLTLALDYSGQNDILTATNTLIKTKVRNATQNPSGKDVSQDSIADLEEEHFAAHLMTRDLPPVDLLIRTGGEQRLSNFMLWPCAYAELWFTPTLWPDFTEHHLSQALAFYHKQERRFGGLSHARQGKPDWRRWISGLVVAGLAAGAVFAEQPGVFIAFIALVAGLAGYEWGRLSFTSRTRAMTVGGSIAIALASVFWLGLFGGLLMQLALAGGQGVISLLTSSRTPFRFELKGLGIKNLNHQNLDHLLPSAGILYLGGAGLAILAMHSWWGAWFVTWVIVIVAAVDTGAYFGGRAIGGRLLAPRVSPGKTWAGLLAGVLAGVLGSLIVPQLNPAFAQWHGEHTLAATLLGFAIALISQMGDLAESWLKRRQGIKDSGGLIPGHGGVLDRVDGLLAGSVLAFTALVLWDAVAGLPVVGG